MGYNKGNVGMVFFAMSMLLGMALLGAFIPEGAKGDTVIDNHLVSDVSVDPDWVYDTSTVDVDVGYTLAPVSPELILSNLTITYHEVGSATLPAMIYSWNLTSDGGVRDNPFVWSLNGTLNVGVYVLNVTADYFNGTSGGNHIGSGEAHFEVIEGTPMIGGITSDLSVVDNSGNDEINMTISFNRAFEELDTENDNFTLQFFHVDSMEWVDWDVLDFPEPEPENITMGLHNASAYGIMPIPYDLPVGEYKVYMHAIDLWGYEEDYNETIFTVIWRELPPEMTNDTIYMHEDDYAVVDLDDHFDDVNGQDLSYYINLSAVENLTITWVDEHTINITAPADWNGEQTFGVAVTDGIDMIGHNETYTMNVVVIPTPDDLRMVEDNVIMINEEEMERAFNPQSLFYDPDGPVSLLTVSLGWEWALNETNVSYMKPILNWTDGNFSISINESDNTDGMAVMARDLEEGSAEFPVSAWINGTFVMNGTAVVEIEEVNDVPAPVQDTLELYRNEPQTFNLSALFSDPDSTDLNFTVNSTMAENVEVSYDWETFMLTITPALNWTGSTEFNVTATDGTDEAEYTFSVNVILRSYTVTGKIIFDSEMVMDVNFSNITLTIGSVEVPLNETGAFQIVLEEGDYEVSLVVPDEFLYSEADKRSGFEIDEIPPINLTADQTYELTLTYREYEEPVEEGTWDDLDLSDVIIEEDGQWTFIVKVKDEALNKSGWDTFVIKLVIKDSDEKNFTFPMEWDATNGSFVVTLTDDDLNDLGEGEKTYFFTNDDGTQTSDEKKYEFKSEDKKATAMTIIILVALIILVLIALVFIMKKPSDEDFEDEEDEEDEEEGRVCPGCGEIITDDEAEECPYCGEDLTEE